MVDTPDKNKMLLAQLIMMLSSSAMQQMGKLVNPMTNKTEVSLEGARMTIDMMEMIREKTKGNLDEEEEKMLKEILSTCQMNFVETSQNPPKQETEKEEADKTSDETPENESEEDEKKPEEKTDEPEEDKKDSGGKDDEKKS